MNRSTNTRRNTAVRAFRARPDVRVELVLVSLIIVLLLGRSGVF